MNGQIFNKGFSAILQLLQNALGKDLVAAPRVICADGKDSKVVIAREMRYPTSYTQPTIPVNDTGSGNGFILPANPTGFEERDIGVTMKVNASSTALPTAVDLKLDDLAIVDFNGFINYGTIINSVSYGSAGVSPEALTPTDSPFLVPIFSRRSVVSQIRMLDGETFAIGGLIAEADQIVDDKVPILGDLPVAGRFFRSEVSQKVKNNLVIFTTVRIVNPDGTLKFPENQENPDSNPNETGDIISSVR